MRDYLFRGKDHGGKWVYGSLVAAEDFCGILEKDDGTDYNYPYLDNLTGCIDGYITPVLTNTVGQYIGLVDKTSTKIFEGDIIKTVEGAFKVVYEHGATWLYDELLLSNNHLDFLGSYETDAIEVVSNIHDNPELLRGEIDV